MRVLITGVTGQAGTILAEQLTDAGHAVHGLVRGQARAECSRLPERIADRVSLIEGDLSDQSSLISAIHATEPDVVYNLAAATFVGMSWRQPAVMSEITGVGALRVLEAIRIVNPKIRFVQASSSEQFGSSGDAFQEARAQMDELVPFRPRSPYGVAKTFAHLTTVNYRESYGLHASTAIMFNYESPRRGPEFLPRKVSLAVSRIAAGETVRLKLGNLDTMRDWGWAEEYMAALPLIAAQEFPDDYVLATGEAHTVRELISYAYEYAGLGQVVMDRTMEELTPEHVRPADIAYLCGDASKAKAVLGWEATWKFRDVVRGLVDADMKRMGIR